MLTQSTPTFMSLLPSIASPIQEHFWNIPWQTLRPGEIRTHTRRITWLCLYIMRNDEFDKSYKFSFRYCYASRCNQWKVFSDTYTIKVCTSWDLSPHCSGGRNHHHITHINPFAKYQKFGGVNARSLLWLEKSWLDSWMERLGSGGIWTHDPVIPQKLHYIIRNYAYTNYTKFHVATAEHRFTDTGKVLKYLYLEKHWDRTGFEPTLVG